MERRIQQRANAFHQRNAQPHQLRTPMRNAPDHRQQWRQKGSRYLASPPRPPLDPRRAARGRSNGPARYRAALGTTSRSNPNNQISTVQGIARPSAMASSSIHRGRVIRHFLVAFTAGEAKGTIGRSARSRRRGSRMWQPRRVPTFRSVQNWPSAMILCAQSTGKDNFI